MLNKKILLKTLLHEFHIAERDWEFITSGLWVLKQPPVTSVKNVLYLHYILY